MAVLKSENGKWEVQLRDVDFEGKEKRVHKRGFATKSEAKKWEAEYLSKGKFDEKTTMNEIWEAYRDEVLVLKKPNTIKTTSTNMRKHILPYFGMKPMSEIDEAMIRKWQVQMRDKRNRNGDPFTDIHLRKINTNFNTVYRFGIKRCGIDKDVSRDVNLLGSSQTREMKIWTFEEYKAFRKALDENGTEQIYKVAFDILYYTGIREGELLALTRGSFDFSRHELKVNKNLQRVEGKIYIQTPKTRNSVRSVAIPEFLEDEVDDFIRKSAHIQTASDLIFPIAPATLRRKLVKGAMDAGVPAIKVHDLRHSHASFLIEKGVNIASISKRLGHEGVDITLKTYTHLYDKNAGMAIANMINGVVTNDENGGEKS